MLSNNTADCLICYDKKYKYEYKYEFRYPSAANMCKSYIKSQLLKCNKF